MRGWERVLQDDREAVKERREQRIWQVFRLARKDPRLLYKVEDVIDGIPFDKRFYIRLRFGLIDGTEYAPIQAAEIMGEKYPESKALNYYELQMWRYLNHHSRYNRLLEILAEEEGLTLRGE